VRLRIVVDERERKSGIPDLLRRAGAVIDFAQLKVGDYVISPETAIERKTIQDLLNSIYDGRLFIQCSQLNEHYVKPVLIVEGNIVDLMETPGERQEVGGEPATNGEGGEDESVDEAIEFTHEKPEKPERSEEEQEESIRSKDAATGFDFERAAIDHRTRARTLIEKIPLIYDALANVALDFRIPIIHTPSVDFTSQLLVVMVNKSLRNSRTTGPLLKRIKKSNPGYIQQLSILSSIPGIGDKLAVRMLDKFQTPSRALNASAAELARISGFGTERAARVRRILDGAMRHNNVKANQSAGDGKTIEKGLEIIQRTLFLEELNDGNNSKKSEHSVPCRQETDLFTSRSQKKGA
jgi:ERCC4-type nuclease